MVTETLKLHSIIMKNNPMTTVLLGVLTVSALASVVLCLLFASSTRQKNLLQNQASLIINKRTVISALVNDAAEYSKKNPAINPILESVGLKLSTSSPTPTSKTITK